MCAISINAKAFMLMCKTRLFDNFKNSQGLIEKLNVLLGNLHYLKNLKLNIMRK